MIGTKLAPADKAAAAMELRRRRRRKSDAPVQQDWEEWLLQRFPKAVYAPFAPRHRRLWEWFESLRPGQKPRARCEFWPRGGAKSSTTELGVVRVSERRTRSFALYVSGTQKQANKHVQAIAHRFEVLGIGRALNGFGNSLGWRMDMLRVSNGFNVLALGLDAAGRGVKIEDDRPDLIILDDIDERHDSADTVKKKVETITESILPTGSPDAAVLFVQNLIHADSVATQLADGTADFLLDREMYQEPAVEGLKIESRELPEGGRRYVIIDGVATWQGQDLETCEAQLNEWGRAAFFREAQHQTDEEEDGLWLRTRDIEPFRKRLKEIPELYRVAVAIDPNASEGNDEAGIMVGGIGRIGLLSKQVVHGYLLEDCTVDGGPKTWAQAAVDAYHRWMADVMVAEKNNGGDMIKITISTIPKAPPVKLIWASRGKAIRAEPVQKLGEDGRIHHVGPAGEFMELERELVRWRPGNPSPNRLDAYVWLFTELMLGSSIDPAAFTASTKK